MPNKIIIEPQDKTPLVKKEFQLHPKQLARLMAFAEQLNSDVNYTLGQIIDKTEIGNGGVKRGRKKSGAAEKGEGAGA